MELQVLADWFRANKLFLNISKTKCMLFCRSPPPENEEFILTMSNTIIQHMKCVQFLGIHIDEKPDLHEHINKCKNKLLQFSLPLLDIWNHLVGSTYKTYLTQLFSIKKIVRSILKRNYWEHSHPLFTCLKFIKLNDVYELEIGKFMYNYIHRSLPHYLLVSLHLPMTYTFMKLGKPHTYVLLLL